MTGLNQKLWQSFSICRCRIAGCSRIIPRCEVKSSRVHVLLQVSRQSNRHMTSTRVPRYKLGNGVDPTRVLPGEGELAWRVENSMHLLLPDASWLPAPGLHALSHNSTPSSELTPPFTSQLFGFPSFEFL